MAPGYWLAVAALGGGAIGVCGHADPRAWLAVAIGAVAMSAGWERTRWACLVVAVGAVVAARAADARATAFAPSLARWFAAQDGGTALVLEGDLARDAGPMRGGGVRLVIDVARVFPPGSEPTGPGVAVAGRVHVRVAGTLGVNAIEGWTRGRRVRAPVALRWPAFVRNPGSPSLEWQALVRGYALTGSIKSAALVTVTPGVWWEESAAAARRLVRRATTAQLGDAPVARSIVTALLIGDRVGLDAVVEDRLIDAGTFHVLAISGGNIAIWTAVVVAAVGLILRSARLVALVGCAAVAVYGVVVAGEPSVARAVTAAVFWLGARAVGFETRPFHVFSLVTVVLLVSDPLAIVDAGAWLSFGATWAILTLAEPFARLCGVGGTATDHIWGRVLRFGFGVMATSMAVQVVLLPVGAAAFGRVALAAPLFNLVAVPVVVVAQLAGMLAVMAWIPAPVVAAQAADLARWACDALVASSAVVEWVPWLAWRVPAPRLWWAAVFYATALGAVLGWPRPGWRRGLGLVAVAAVFALPWSARLSRDVRLRGWLRVTMLDVGQGDATVVEFPSGRSLLIDAGNRTLGFDSGDRVVTPALWALGLRRLDWLALSHADADHAGGLPAVVEAFAPREVWEGLPVPGDAGREALRASAARAGASWREVRRGDRLDVDGVSLEVLHPAPPEWERRRVRNEDSVVLRLRWGALDLLLPGDAGTETERAVVRATEAFAERGRLRVLKVGHHGSRTSTSAELLDSFRPTLAVISAGRNNVFGHPAAEVLHRLQAIGASVVRTDRDGALSVETDGTAVRATAWSGRFRLRAGGDDARRP